MEPSDSVFRAMTNDGSFRVVTTRMTQTVRAVAALQQARGEPARLLADMLTAAVLVRETMAPRLRVQGILQGPRGRGSIVADSHPDGAVRGLITHGKSGALELGPGSVLQMMRTLPNGHVHRGVVEVPSAGGISAAVMGYMQDSEQVLSVISVGCHIENGEIAVAGGYVVQLLPEVSEGVLMVMTERLKEFPSVEQLLGAADGSPASLAEELLWGMEFTRLDETPVRFECQCSDVRVLTSLATLPRAEIEALMHDGTPLEIGCDYCTRQYQVEPEQLRGLLEAT